LLLTYNLFLDIQRKSCALIAGLSGHLGNVTVMCNSGSVQPWLFFLSFSPFLILFLTQMKRDFTAKKYNPGLEVDITSSLNLKHIN